MAVTSQGRYPCSRAKFCGIHTHQTSLEDSVFCNQCGLTVASPAVKFLADAHSWSYMGGKTCVMAGRKYACLPVGWDERVGQVAEAEASVADDHMHRATQAAISQVWLAGAVIDGACALINVVVSVESHIHLRNNPSPQVSADSWHAKSWNAQHEAGAGQGECAQIPMKALQSDRVAGSCMAVAWTHAWTWYLASKGSRESRSS